MNELVGSPYLFMSAVWLSTHNTKRFLFQSVAKLCLTGYGQRNRGVFDSGDVEKSIHRSKVQRFRIHIPGLRFHNDSLCQIPKL